MFSSNFGKLGLEISLAKFDDIFFNLMAWNSFLVIITTSEYFTVYYPPSISNSRFYNNQNYEYLTNCRNLFRWCRSLARWYAHDDVIMALPFSNVGNQILPLLTFAFKNRVLYYQFMKKWSESST